MIEGLPVAGGPRSRSRRTQPVGATEEILGQFLGDDAFPVDWASDAEQDLFWVYDDLHCPHPAEPDVLRHRRLVAELRPHVPPVRHAVRRRLAGQERQRLPLHRRRSRPTRTCAIDGTEYGARYGARVPRDAAFAERDGRATSTPSCRSTASTSPTGGATASSPRCSATSRTSRRSSTAADGDDAWPRSPCCSRTRSTSTTGTGRSTGCSTSPSCRATLNLRAVMERTRGSGRRGAAGPAPELGRRTATGTRSRPCGG